MELKQLQAEYHGAINAAKALRTEFNGKDMPQDKVTELTGLLGKADDIKAKIDLVRRMDGHEEGLRDGGDTKAAHNGWREAAPGEGDYEVDTKAWRTVEAKNIFGKIDVKYHVPLAMTKDKTTERNYSNAFELYLRKGWAGLDNYPSERKTLSIGTDSAGGYLVPPDYMAELIRKTAVNAVVRPNARVIQTSRDTVELPRVNYTTDNKYTSGVRLTWTGETPSSSTVHRVTDPVFGKIVIPVHVAMASMPMTNSLLEDAAFDVGAYSAELLGETFALGEDDVFLNGTGVGQPMGLLTEVGSTEAGANGPVYVVSGTSAAIATSSDASNFERILDLYYALPAQYRSRAAWMMASTTAREVEQLVDADKRPIIGAQSTISLATGEFDTIKGRPNLIDEFTPAIAADSYPIIFGDFSGYMIADRVGLSISRNTVLYEETDITLLIARKRVGGYCVAPFRFRVMKAGTS